MRINGDPGEEDGAPLKRSGTRLNMQLSSKGER
jgi:hypothetical protein